MTRRNISNIKKKNISLKRKELTAEPGGKKKRWRLFELGSDSLSRLMKTIANEKKKC